MNNTLGCTDREIIQMIARKHGSEERPSFYIDKAMSEYRRKVSNSSVTKSIGTYANRIRGKEDILIEQARVLLASCRYDTAYAQYMIAKAFMT